MHCALRIIRLPSFFQIDATMSSPLSIPAVINVEAEINYWRDQHGRGELKSTSFGHYIPWIKFACDSLISQPRASDSERDEAFTTNYDFQIMPRLTQAEARDFVERVWDHVYFTSDHDQSARPRLGVGA